MSFSDILVYRKRLLSQIKNNIFGKIKLENSSFENKLMFLFLATFAICSFFVQYFSLFRLRLELINYFLVFILPFCLILISFKIFSSEDFKNFSIQKENLWYGFLFILLIFYYFFFSRPDLDDVFFVGSAQQASQYPYLPIFKYDLLHFFPTERIEMGFTPRILHSIIAIVASFTNLTGIDAIYFFHVFFPLIFIFCFVTFFKNFYQYFLNEKTPLGLPLHILILVILGGVHAQYGNLAFIRFFQGKAFFVTVCIPAIFFHCFKIFHDKKKIDFIWLMLWTMISTGIHLSAIWIIPIFVTLFLLIQLIFFNKDKIIGFKIFLFSSYPLIVGISYILLAKYAITLGNGSLGKEEILQSFNYIYDGQLLLILIFYILLFFNYFFTRDEISKFLLIYSLLVLFFIANPLLIKFLPDVIPKEILWRIWWIVPLPTILTFSILHFVLNKKIFRQDKYSILSFLIIFFLLIISQKTITISEKNNVTFGFNLLKVPKEYYEIKSIFQKIKEKNSEQIKVALPILQSNWSNLTPGNIKTIASRRDYLEGIKGGPDGNKLYELQNILDGESSNSKNKILEILSATNINYIGFNTKNNKELIKNISPFLKYVGKIGEIILFQKI